MSNFREKIYRFVAMPLIVLGVCVGGFVALGGRPDVGTKDDETVPVPLVEVVKAESHTDGMKFNVDGVAMPHRELLLTAKVAGPVETKADECKAGRFVKAGDLLLEVDPRDYQLEVERLTRELRQAEGSIKEADVEIANTKDMLALVTDELELRTKELERAQRLFTRNVVTDAEIDNAKRNELQVRNNYQSTQNQLRLLNARRERLDHSKALVQSKLDMAELNLKRTRITAPVDGVIVKDHVEAGTYVQPGTTLVTLEDTSSVDVRCNLRMEELNWLWRQESAPAANDMTGAQREYLFPTTDVTIFFELGGHRFTWDGVLSRYDGVGLDMKTRTVPCRVFVETPCEVGIEGSDAAASSVPGLAGPPALMRGMFVTVQIHARPKSDFLILPEKAVRPGNEVWVVRDDKLSRCAIHVARVTESGVLIDAARSELSEGDLVVTTPMTATPRADGLGFAEDGMPVRVKAPKESPKT